MKKFLFFFFFLFFQISISFAGNPNYMNPDTDMPLIWDTSTPIPYRVDADGFGRLTYEQSLELVQMALAQWEDIEGTNIQFEYIGPTDVDITIDNWETYANNDLQTETADRDLLFVFDETGDIIDATGIGTDNNDYGVTELTGILGTRTSPQFVTRSIIYVNGSYIDEDTSFRNRSIKRMFATIVHEIGHALGLDHVVASNVLYEDEYYQYVPTMYLYIQNDCGPHTINLSPDDIATIKWMYGSTDVHTILGNIYTASGTPQDSATVSIRKIDSPLCRSYEQTTRVLCTDWNGVADGSGLSSFNFIYCQQSEKLGYFSIPVLEDGEYIVDVQELDTDLPVGAIPKFGRFNPPSELAGEAEFYNENDAVDEDPYTYSVVTVAGSDIEDINIYLSSNTASDTALKRIPYTYFSEDDFFTNLEDDVYCSPDYDIDVAGLIGVEEVVTDSCSLGGSSSTTTGGSTTGSSTTSSGSGTSGGASTGSQASDTNAASAGGCSLRP